MKTMYVIEIDGGPLNGAKRRYGKLGIALREAKRYIAWCERRGCPESIWVDVYVATINTNSTTKKLITTIEL